MHYTYVIEEVLMFIADHDIVIMVYTLIQPDDEYPSSRLSAVIYSIHFPPEEEPVTFVRTDVELTCGKYVFLSDKEQRRFWIYVKCRVNHHSITVLHT